MQVYQCVQKIIMGELSERSLEYSVKTHHQETSLIKIRPNGTETNEVE